MSDLFSIGSKIVPVDKGLGDKASQLVRKLIQFTDKYYYLAQHTFVVDSIIKPEQAGDIILFYGEADELVGFTRIYEQKIIFQDKPTTIYAASTYNNPTHNISLTAARLALTQTMKHKLAHPEEELVHFSCAYTPDKYHFLAKLSDQIHPQPEKEIPSHVLQMAHILKENNGWQSSSDHPLLITGQLARKNKIHQNHEGLHTKYYYSLNPDYTEGNAILVYLPLNLLSTIGHSLRQILIQDPEQVVY